jgi:uncharacterized membrane protein
MEKIKGAIRKTFIAGLVVVVPIVVTGLALFYLFRLLDGFLSPVIEELAGRDIPGLGILAEIIVIFLVGLVAANVFGSRLLKWIQNTLMHIPVVKNIYPTVKQLVEAFHPSGSSSYRKVVLVEYPRRGIYTLGFLTSEVALNGVSEEHQFFSVYLPTNNLYIGQVALFRSAEVIITNFTVEEGLKIILSGGTAFPPTIQSRNLKSIP